MLFNTKLPATLLAAFILAAATNADAMGFDLPNLNRQLITATENNNYPVVRHLLATGAQISMNEQNEHGLTALTTAAFRGHIAITQALIAAGANVNALNAGGWTPLIAAAHAGHWQIVQILINAHANVNAQTNIEDHLGGGTALIWTAFHGNAEIAEALINAGANVNALNQENYTASMIAARRGHWHIVDLILNVTYTQKSQEEREGTRIALLSIRAHRDPQTPAHQALQAVGRTPFVLNALLETIHPELPTYQWLQEQLGEHYAAYREWKRTQPGHEHFDENYNGAGPANA